MKQTLIKLIKVAKYAWGVLREGVEWHLFRRWNVPNWLAAPLVNVLTAIVACVLIPAALLQIACRNAYNALRVWRQQARDHANLRGASPTTVDVLLTLVGIAVVLVVVIVILLLTGATAQASEGGDATGGDGWLSIITGTFGAAAAAGGSILGAASGGGIMGIIGSTLGGFFKLRQAAHDLKKKAIDNAHELELQKLHLQQKREETEQEAMLQSVEGSLKGLLASHKSDAALAQHTHMWVNDIKALFRPVLTIGLLLVSAGIIHALFTSPEFVKVVGLDTAQRLIIYAVEAMVFATSTAIVWWFGDRSIGAIKAMTR